MVMRLLAHKFEHRTRFADYAILYRGNHQARVFEQALRNENIPYQLSGGQSFFDRAEIKDVIAYLRLIANSDDDPAFIRAVTTPKRGIGTPTLEKLGSYAAQRHHEPVRGRVRGRRRKPSSATKQYHAADRVLPLHQPPAMTAPNGNRPATIIERPAQGDRLRDATCSTGRAARGGKQMEQRAGIRRLARQEGRGGRQEPHRADPDHRADQHAGRPRGSQDPDAVRLSTLHAAKGLEFPTCSWSASRTASCRTANASTRAGWRKSAA